MKEVFLLVLELWPERQTLGVEPLEAYGHALRECRPVHTISVLFLCLAALTGISQELMHSSGALIFVTDT